MWVIYWSVGCRWDASTAASSLPDDVIFLVDRLLLSSFAQAYQLGSVGAIGCSFTGCLDTLLAVHLIVD